MIKCSDGCTPCCDFCIHTIHEILEYAPMQFLKGGPIHCKLHPDDEHDKLCECGSFCDDFHCYRANIDK